MAILTWATIVTGWCISIAGAIALCHVIERRNQAESRRKLFGLSPDETPWP